MVTTGEEAATGYRTMSGLDECRQERTLLATRGEHVALTRTLTWFRSGEVGPSEVECLTVIEVDEQGLVVREVAFDVADVDAAFAELGQAGDPARTPRSGREEAAPGITDLA